ncbi:DUF1844 domain-containing protein [Candidatus Nitronereus thalassa]|uniref:DUF1844 domain-containing protein n=1 Tax=Candidatus Nitronereus thalassa TaxID=3020898 RepID=A0ABU3K4D0_9BACT|nr:DUF1844 domain-containing protein [Candidatus Nitronereus thalassa]MDT7041229.1 DUF1844 domain-containing protein [Candidatus Nitronereus thalassa]
MAEEEGQGFVIRDKRGQAREESPTPAPEAGASSSSHAASEKSQEHAPPLTFSSFIFSLGTSALMLMGEKLSPDQPNAPVNLPQAKEIIDILSMLEEKTKGNLSTEEAAVIKDMLYTLRMKFVEATSEKKPKV